MNSKRRKLRANLAKRENFGGGFHFNSGEYFALTTNSQKKDGIEAPKTTRIDSTRIFLSKAKR